MTDSHNYPKTPLPSETPSYHSDKLGTEENNLAGLQRKLNARHLTFISLGSVIGTGIFLGIGNALVTAGPVGLVLAYAVICSVVYCVMLCVGEMVTYLPVVGAHLRLSARFVDPSLSAAMSWNYWYCWALIAAVEASAVAVLMTYWTDAVNSGAWIAICLAVTLGVNLCGPRVYAEVECYMSSIKVLTIVGLIVLSIAMDAGAGSDGEVIGFRHWTDPGPFVQYQDVPSRLGQFLGFFSGLTTAAFSSIGAEMLALVAAETRNPRVIVPRALKATWIRVVLFYFLGAFCVSLIVPSNELRLGSASTASASPYVIAIENAGIKVLPHIINACILTSALSAGISDLFTATRTLHAMAGSGLAPKLFSQTTSWGCPWIAVLATWSIGLLAFLTVGSSAAGVFIFLVKLTALSGVITWECIAVTYLRFRAGMKAQQVPKSVLPWKSGFSTIGAWWIIIVISSVLLFSGWPVFKQGNWSTADFFGNYLPLMIFVAVYGGFKVGTRSRFVRASEMDLTSGLEEIERRTKQCEEEDEAKKAAKPRSRVATVLRRLVA
ncbi:amino acid permease/ SLC12A domain-containing protein [Emericellopsis atlantica]|uniref:Amino acid permease/ SLC12A domain-containing protein n=1 Tax=Emericellopsis atlantica TaxID=2614577 RepID=A0A9P7ZPH2_9HYPO|nr:amino acid permease/ SLC12A domain-containing protein [Emericellopsis atlantica]KAG9255303.1 amino acid permease/ SLC12A domain-containing protein [Emericellopsis atlantica]